MSKRRLKSIIGVIYLFLIILLVIVLFQTKSDLWRKLWLAYIGIFVGIFARALIYYGILKKDGDEASSQDDRNTIIFDYSLYGVMGLALCSIIFMSFYDAMLKMAFDFYALVSFPFFSYAGFSILEVTSKFLQKK